MFLLNLNFMKKFKILVYAKLCFDQMILKLILKVVDFFKDFPVGICHL